MNDYRQRLRCNVARVDDIFADCLAEAQGLLSPAGVEAYLDGASILCGMGRGQDLPVIYLQVMPRVAHIGGEALLGDVVDVARLLARAGSPQAIGPLLSQLPVAARRLETRELIAAWFDLINRLTQEAPAGLIPFLQQTETLLGQLSIGGVRNWVANGLRTWRTQLHKAGDYFSLQSADARAALQRERRGTLLADQARALNLTLRALWGLEDEIHPYSTGYDIDRRPRPHLDKLGFHVPDVYEDAAAESTSGSPAVSGLDRYRAALAHLAAHRLWTRPLIADNFNRFQQLIIETFEDARIEWLAMQHYPGLRRLWLAQHPKPVEGACPPGHSCIRHYAAILSRALLDPQHEYRDPRLLAVVAAFHARVASDPHDRTLVTDLGVDYLVKIHEVDFRSPRVFFTDTEVSYRDDNRFLWIFLEDTDDEDDFHSDHHAANPRQRDEETRQAIARHHPEWDCESQSYRHDWTTVYEALPPAGDARRIDALLASHAVLARRLKQMVDRLKPQGRVRVRYQEDGSELDLDVAVRALIEQRGGITPDPRIHQSQQPDERSISVLVLVDLSESINETPPGLETSVLELSREAVSLLGWALNELGDPYAIAGFSSNSRYEVRYQHFKGFGEDWNDTVKARLAGMQGALSTRMGTALRHAGHYLSRQSSAKKLLLLLTDGEPADIDVDDPAYLHADTRKAVEELAAVGVSTFCFSLDPRADEYVAGIFGASHYMVLDRVERLPERLPALYLRLTG